MATVKYYPYKKIGTSKIYIRLNLDKKKSILQSTGLTIEDAKTWNYETQLPVKKSAKNKILHKKLIGLRTVIEDTIDVIEKSETQSSRDLTGKWLKKIILNFNNETPLTEMDSLTGYANKFTNSLDTYTKKGVKHKYTQYTISKYKNFTRQLEEFEKYKKKKYTLYEVDLDFQKEFLEFLTDIQDLSINTKGMYIKRLKTIVKSAEDSGLKVNVDYRKLKGFQDENIVTYLTFDEIEQIIDAEMPTKRLKIAKDWFIISCFTAQRISDLFRLSKKNIQNIEGGEYIVLRQYKTKKYVEIPIHYHVKSILKKHNGFPKKISENEQSNRSLLSSAIKEVCRISKIRENVRGRYNGVIGIYPKWKLISNHTGRRSFACNFHNLKDWSNKSIMDITGHDNESSFYTYIDKSDSTVARLNRSLMDNMEQEYKKKKNSYLKIVGNE